MSGEFDSGKDSNAAIFEERPQILAKLSVVHAFDKKAISLSQKRVLVALTENSFLVTKLHHGTSRIFTPPETAVKTLLCETWQPGILTCL